MGVLDQPNPGMAETIRKTTQAADARYIFMFLKFISLSLHICPTPGIRSVKGTEKGKGPLVYVLKKPWAMLFP
jgi:hypothetical protein